MTDRAKSNPNSEPYPQHTDETKAEQMSVEQVPPYAVLGKAPKSSVDLFFKRQAK